MNFKPQLDRKVVATLIIALLMFVLMGIESPYRFSPDIDKIRLLYFPLFLLAVYAVLNWAVSAGSERQIRLKKMKHLMSEMDQTDLDLLRNRLIYTDDDSSDFTDGEFESLEGLLQEKQKHKMR